MRSEAFASLLMCFSGGESALRALADRMSALQFRIDSMDNFRRIQDAVELVLVFSESAVIGGKNHGY